MRRARQRSSPGHPNKPLAKCSICLQIFCNLLAIFLIVFTVLLFPSLYQEFLNERLVLANGSLSFAEWREPSLRVYKTVTVYNITNPGEVGRGGRPVLQALGPYYYRQHRERVEVGVAGRELSFRDRTWYQFDYEKSNENRTARRTALLDPVTDVFTTINLGYIGVANNLTASGAEGKIIENVTAAALEHDTTLFMTRSVSDVAFGYKDQFLSNLTSAIPALSALIPGLSDQVNLLHSMSSNETRATSRIHSGQRDISSLGQYSQWHGLKRVPYWKTPEAAIINGTEGLFFAPNLDKRETITVFEEDFFRAIPMEFVEEEERLTLQTYKYRLPKYVLMNSTNNPLNSGYHAYGPAGLINLTAVTRVPVFASKPSFLDAEPWLSGEITGLPPTDRDTMDTNLWVEPVTGALVKARKGIQMNAMIRKLPRFPQLGKLRDTPRYVPILKTVETRLMNEDRIANILKDKILRPRDHWTIGLWVLFGLCTFLGVVSGFLRYIILRLSQNDLYLHDKATIVRVH